MIQGLYAIVDTTHCPHLSPPTLAELYLKGGARLLQLRQKKAPKKEILENAKQIVALKKNYDFTLIINDDPEIAAEIGADGVHVGQEDVSILQARNIVGSSCLIGKSTHSFAQAKLALQEDINYLSCGAVFKTRSKPKNHPVMGLETLAHIVCKSHLPVVAIGGIKKSNIEKVLQTGVKAVALISGLTQAKDVMRATEDYLQFFGLKLTIAVRDKNLTCV